MATTSSSMRRSSSLLRGDDAKDEHGHLQSLSSPILGKINDGFVCFKAAITGKANDKYTAFYTFEGASRQLIRCKADR